MPSIFSCFRFKTYKKKVKPVAVSPFFPPRYNSRMKGVFDRQEKRAMPFLYGGIALLLFAFICLAAAQSAA